MSAAEVLRVLEGDGVQLYLEDGKLKWRGPKGAYTELHKALVNQHREAVVKHLGGAPSGVGDGGPGVEKNGTTPKRPVSPELWPSDLVDWALSLTASELPPFPFKTRPGVSVVGPQWLPRLQEDLRRGPHSPRARTGAIAEDLFDLRALLNPAPELSGEKPGFRSDGDQGGRSRGAKKRTMSGKAPRKASSQAS